MEINFSGKTALVTGAAQGIGLAIVKKLASCGASVIAVDVKEDQLKEVSKIPGVSRTVVVDLSKWSSTLEVLKGIPDVQLVVNNAGVNQGQNILGLTEDSVDRILQVNIKGVMAVSQYAVKNWISTNKTGAIVNIASIYAIRPGIDSLSYQCSKAAVAQFTRCLALECAPYNIRVNAVSPGITRTQMVEDYRATYPEEFLKLAAKVPTKEPFVEPEDIANAVAFLLCDVLARKITGVNLPVDSGFLLT